MLYVEMLHETFLHFNQLIITKEVGKKIAGLFLLEYQRCNIDASIIYADYYYLEALLRLKKMDQEHE